MTEDAPVSSPAPAADAATPDMRMAPGGPRALATGCVCSVLANAAYRAGTADEPCIDPRCPLHAKGAAAPSA